MQVNKYDPNTLTLLQSDITGIHFGDTLQGDHCKTVHVVRPEKTTESEISELSLFLANQGAYNKSSFGYLVSGGMPTGVLPGSPVMSNHFVSGMGVSMQDGDYALLDIQAGDTEKGDYPGISYRFTFDYV
jgi:hypothetical protein